MRPALNGPGRPIRPDVESTALTWHVYPDCLALSADEMEISSQGHLRMPNLCWCENPFHCWCENPFSHPPGTRWDSRPSGSASIGCPMSSDVGDGIHIRRVARVFRRGGRDSPAPNPAPIPRAGGPRKQGIPATVAPHRSGVTFYPCTGSFPRALYVCPRPGPFRPQAQDTTMHARKSEISKRTHFSRLARQKTRPVAKRTHSAAYKGQPKTAGQRSASAEQRPALRFLVSADSVTGPRPRA